MHNKSNVSDGHSESEVILITIYQLTKKKKNNFINLRHRKTSNMVIIAFKKEEEKKKSNEFFKRGVYHVWHAIYFFFWNMYGMLFMLYY